MTRELSSYLTKKSAAFLRDAVGAINRDRFDRHNPEESTNLQAIQIAFDWQATDNETRSALFIQQGKMKAHTIEMETKFKEGVEAVCVYMFDSKKTWPMPLDWTAHFAEYPINKATMPCAPPDEKTLLPGSLCHCMAWSDYNIQRVTQHLLTLRICEEIVRDKHMFKHLELPLAHAKAWTFQQTARLEAVRTELILLEGDPDKIQALRERMLDGVRLENRSMGHFYGHLNDPYGSNAEADKRFREEALHHVQVGFNRSVSGPGGDVSYSDLGLG